MLFLLLSLAISVGLGRGTVDVAGDREGTHALHGELEVYLKRGGLSRRAGKVDSVVDELFNIANVSGLEYLAQDASVVGSPCELVLAVGVGVEPSRVHP